MKLIVGLGNPGNEYEKTRHNAGFLAVDALREELKGTPWKFEKKWNAEISTMVVGDQKITLAKPQTFMNNSGEAVGAVARFYKVAPADVWVAHDELDFPCGTLKIKVGGSAAGHNGVQSVINAIGNDFVRFRIGINTPHEGPSEDFVLKPFSKDELKILKEVVDRFKGSASVAIWKGLGEAMNQFNK